ncbi:MAG: divalent-cation tolerance protein CutA [Desulfobacterales bacterium]
MTVLWVYMTAGNLEEARRIGEVLVKERLAACVNMIDGMRSLYLWKDELQDDAETVLIAKTTSERLDRMVETVKRLHSYECPCIVALPSQGGNPEFLDWVRSCVEAPGDS